MPVLMRPWGHMHYKDSGTGLPVLFANSLGTDLRMWAHVSSQLACRSIGFDMRGHGLSATPLADWAVEDIAADAVALLDHLGIDRAVIAGCSVGGMVAQAFGIQHPTRARALLLSNTAAKIGSNDSWTARINAVQSGGIASIADTILDRWFAPPFRTSPDVLPWATMLLRTDPVGYVQTCRALACADLRAGLPTLALPVLVIAGSEDQSTPLALVQETAAAIPGAVLAIVQGSGHIPAIDAPDVTAHLIGGFLERLND